jgi:hypothetical protein
MSKGPDCDYDKHNISKVIGERLLIRGGSRISSYGGALKKIALSGGRRENVWGISCEKSRLYAKKSYFFQFYGGAIHLHLKRTVHGHT